MCVSLSVLQEVAEKAISDIFIKHGTYSSIDRINCIENTKLKSNC